MLRVAIPAPLYQLFDYAAPERAAGGTDAASWVGQRVEVKFGRRRELGIVVETDPPDAHERLSPITAQLDPEPMLDNRALALGRWLASYYQHPLGEVLPLLLPPALRRPVSFASIKPEQTLIAYRRSSLDATGEEALEVALARAPKQRALLARLADAPATRKELTAEGFGGPIIKALETLGAIERFDVVEDQSQLKRRLDPPSPPRSQPLALNDEQNAALEQILRDRHRFNPCLLNGVTGSGKTEVYLQAIAAVVAEGRQALVLIPEIALTPQTQARFQRRFPNTACLHSQVADGERLKVWESARRGTLDVVIGTRSAALLPFASLGLIIVDEEHDSSYKQADGLRYSARDLAVKRAADLNLPLVLGSATPALESLRNAHAGRYRHLRLYQRAGGAEPPTLRLLDTRGQPVQDGISLPLQKQIGEHLGAGQQVLIFINRRGYAPSLMCSRCGSSVDCPACEQPMTYHRHAGGQPNSSQPPGSGTSGANAPLQGHLQCHHCGLTSRVPNPCGVCGQGPLVPVGVGTQRTELALRELFPQVPVYRIDRDTARSRKRLEAQFEAIQRGSPAILVGTQILAKGHHFPAVTLVGMLNADAGFTAPDFRAGERTAQLITQVAGRAGRAERPGTVVIQTLQPEQPLLKALIEDGYEAFALGELERRERAGLPPRSALLMVRAEAEHATQARELLEWLKARVPGKTQRIEVLGPAPAPHSKLNHRYRFQLLAIHAQRRVLHDFGRALVAELASAAARQRVRQVRWSIDIDPYDCT